MVGKLGELAATITLDINPFQSSARMLNASIKTTTSALKAQDAALKGSERGIDSLKTHYQTMGQQMSQLQARLKQQAATYENLSKKSAESADAQERLNTRTANAASAYNRTQAEIAKLQSQMGQLNKEILLQSSGWTKASEAAGKFSSATGKIGSGLNNFGNKMTATVTAPLAVGFTAAAKSAIDFNSEIDAIGPLMTNGAAVTGKYRAQLDQMAESSKRWAVQYGLTTSSINNGLADLVRAGYSSQQSLKLMPAILDASRASGEDFNGVMEVVTSTMTQFGVKAKDAATVTDAMTYAANATKSGFGDMGEALKYTGAAANAAGVSLNSTVAMIGLMSNAGLQGSMAGTALNAMLQKLAGASTDADKPMGKLGINIKAFKAGQIGLPEVIDQVAKSTSKMTDVQKVAAINAAFGERGGRAMLALMNQGAPALRTLTAETEKSAGATKKVSDIMGGTAKANFDKLKSSVQVLGIEIGQQLLPALTPLVGQLTDAVKVFGSLDKSTQQSIVKFALFAAAVGPASKVLGGMFSIASKGAGVFSTVAGGIGRASTAAKVGATGFDVLKSGFSKTAFEALKVAPALTGAGTAATGVGTAMTGAATEGTGLLAAITPLGPALVVAGGVALAGVAVWELWGKQAYESGQRAQRWGTDIGEAADRSATKMKDASGKISGALDNTNQSVQTNAKTIVSGFNDMTKAAQQAAKESNTAAEKLAQTLGGEAGRALLKVAAEEKSANDKRIKQLQDNAKLAEQITADANKRGQQLTADQIQVLDNLRQDSAAKAVKMLHLNGQQENNVLKAILGEKVTMSKAAAEKQYSDMQGALQDEYQANTKAQNDIKNNALLTTKEKNAALAGLEQDHQAKLAAIYKGAIQAMKAQGMTNSQVQKQLQNEFDLTAQEAAKAMDSYTKAMAGGVNSSKQFAAAVSDGMSKTVIKAGKDWNSLVLDPKTGKVVTNLPEVLTNTAKTKEGWERLVFDLKHAQISTNAKQMIAETLSMSDQWKGLGDMEKTAIIRVSGGDALASVFDQFIHWDQLDLKQQQAVVKGDYTALVDALIKGNQWDQMSLTQKEAVVKDKATLPLVDILQKSGEWEGLDLSVKEAIVNAKGAPALADLAIKFHNYDQLPDSTKQLLIKDEDARKKLIDAGILIDTYNTGHTVADKVLKADNTDINGKIKQTTDLIEGKYKVTNPDTKQFPADNSGVMSKTNAAMSLISGPYKVTNPANKTFPADNSTVVSKTNTAKATVTSYNGVGVPSKNLKAVDNASGPARNAAGEVTNFKRQPDIITKTLKVVADVSKAAAKFFGFESGTTDLPQDTLAMVNDQRGATYREAIVSPGGQVMIPRQRNVILPLPKHSQVIPAMQTAKLFNVKQFANGTPGYPQTVKEINNMQFAPATNNTTVTTAPTVNQSFSINVTVSGDGKPTVIGREIVDQVMREIKRQQNNTNMAFGGSGNY